MLADDALRLVMVVSGWLAMGDVRWILDDTMIMVSGRG